MRPLATTACVYLFSLLGMAMIGGVVPFVIPIARQLHASAGGVGVGIALFSLPSAVLALMGGVLIDRIGARNAMLGAGLASVLGDLVASRAGGLPMFDLGMLIAGLGMTGIVVGAPALLVDTLAGGARTRAMAFWGTYAPTGFACGLLLALPFTATVGWRAVLLLNAGIGLAVTAIGIAGLPATHAVPVLPDPAGRSVLRHRPALRLALAIAIPNFIAYGTSLAAPSTLARLYHVTLGQSVGAVAAAKIVALLLGGIVTGQVLARSWPPGRMFGLMAGIGALAQLAFFVPLGSFAVAIAGLIAWLFAFGGLSGVAMVLLPTVIATPDRRGATAGLINQFISVLSFAAPFAYFAATGWMLYAALALGGLGLSVALLPGRTVTPG